jgi:hypothetical protein
MKMEITIDVVDGVVPLYDKDKGRRSFFAGKRCMRRTSKVGSSVHLPLFPVTPSLLRSMADTLEFAQKEGKWSVVLAVRQGDNKAGLLCV